MSQKERVDLIEVDLLDMCKYILSKWIFILIGMVVFAGAGFGYAKVKSVTEYSSKMQVYVTVPKTSDKVVIRDSASELATDYLKLIKTDLVVEKIAKKVDLSKEQVESDISAEAVDGTRFINITIESANEDETIKVAKEIIPQLQDVIVNSLGKNKVIITKEPSQIETSQSINTKEIVGIGLAMGLVIVIAIECVMYVVMLNKKRNR